MDYKIQKVPKATNEQLQGCDTNEEVNRTLDYHYLHFLRVLKAEAGLQISGCTYFCASPCDCIYKNS